MQDLGTVGIWSRQLRFGDPVESLEAAAELEELGFGAQWIPDVGGPVLEAVTGLLEATRRVTIATGILNVWMHEAADVADGQARIHREHPGRFLLGLGISHAPIVDAEEPGRYRRPLETMRAYLDALDAHAPSGQRPARVLAALGPKMIELAAERTLGIHPYLVPVEHTRRAREALGAGRLLAPALSVVLDPDRERGRGIARRDVGVYFGLPNYVNAWRRLGFTDADFAGGGSDRLIDSLYACGTAESVARRVEEHHEAGADHVCLRVVTYHADDATRLPREEWRRIAEVIAG